MHTLRIVFMGTPGFAVATLKRLVENKYTIAAVVTAPDRPAGRGRKLRASAVKEYAMANNLKVLQPTHLKNDEFITTLKDLEINLAIVVAFRMLPKTVWQLPEYGTFNLHASLLPNYRGAAPIHWALINGETKTGNTTFFIDEHIDTGAIIFQNEIEISKTDTVGTLHDKLMISGAALVCKTVDSIAYQTVSTAKQPRQGTLKTAYKLHKENTKINWNKTCESLYNHIRGLNPFPAAWCHLENKGNTVTIKLYDTEIDQCHHDLAPGTLLIEGTILKVATKDGFLIIKSLQLPGKRVMDTKALCNGYVFDPEAKLL